MIKSMIFVIKVTHLCNMQCKYCYNQKLDKIDNIIDFVLLEEIIKWIGEFCKYSHIQKAEFVWHGGEPLLPGVEFYKIVNKLQRKYLNNIEYENGLQTNGTLFTPDFINHFKINKYKISVSLDGDKLSNDEQRINSDGFGAFDIIMDNIALLRKEGVSIGISAVVHSQNYQRLIENYLFFKKTKLNYNLVFDFNNTYSESYIKSLSNELNGFLLFGVGMKLR